MRKRGIAWGITGALLFMILPGMISDSVEAVQKYPYTHKPIEEFYINKGIIMYDVCYGDTEQLLTTNRYALGTPYGWPIDVTKELFWVFDNGETQQVHSEIGFGFVEVTKNGTSSRLQSIPVVPVGEYVWGIKITSLYLPYGVVREDVPPINSTTFKVIQCN